MEVKLDDNPDSESTHSVEILPAFCSFSDIWTSGTIFTLQNECQTSSDPTSLDVEAKHDTVFIVLLRTVSDVKTEIQFSSPLVSFFAFIHSRFCFCTYKTKISLPIVNNHSSIPSLICIYIVAQYDLF